MSENQTETNEINNLVAQTQTTFSQILTSWQLKVGLGIVAILGIFTLNFFWPHIVAVQGMKSWAAKLEGAKPSSCVIKDTNDDSYISCTAIRNGELVPLECSANLFNLGCRVSYGSAAPPVRPKS